MNYDELNLLYEDANLVFECEAFKALNKDDMFFVTLFSNSITYLVKKFNENGSEGIRIFVGTDSMSTAYLLSETENKREKEALLYEKRYYTFMRQPASEVPYKYQMFNSAAGIHNEEDKIVVYGHCHEAFGEYEFISSIEVPALRNVLQLIYTADTAQIMGEAKQEKKEDRKGVAICYPAQTWKKTILEDMGDESFFKYALRESDDIVFDSLKPPVRLKDLVYEADFNLVTIVDEEHKLPDRQDVVMSIIDPEKDKFVYIDCLSMNSSLPQLILQGLITSMFTYKYPAKVLCRKKAVYLWLKGMCEKMEVEIELVEKLPSTELLYGILGEDFGRYAERRGKAYRKKQ